MKNMFFGLIVFFAMFFTSNAVYAQKAPEWVTSSEKAFPSKDWVAVTAQGSSRPAAEASAMNALARAFKTDVTSLTQASQKFSQIVNTGSKSVSFDESKNFSQDVNTSTNVRGLIGVELDAYQTPDKTFYVCARMNRKECSARYSGMIQENVKVINSLLASATPVKASLDTYAKLSFAHAIAQVTDNFQNILEVLDPTAANRKPGYGGANSIKTKMIECAGLITIGVAINTDVPADKTLLTRAAGTFFRDLGFKINEQGKGTYVLSANTRFETIKQAVVSCRYYIDAALKDSNGTAVFSFTEDDRKSHPNNESEAKRLAVSAAETSFKDGQFAKEFDTWLNSLLD